MVIIGKINIKHESSITYTNFDLHVFLLSFSKQNHLVNVYRFWSYDSTNSIPNDTAYFSKLTNIINIRNPAFFNVTYISFQSPKYHVEMKNIANYLIYSRYLEKSHIK